MKKSLIALFISSTLLLSGCKDEQLVQRLLESEKQVIQLQSQLAEAQKKLENAQKNFPALQVEIVKLFEKSETLKFEKDPNEEFTREESELAVLASTAKTPIDWLNTLLNKALLQYFTQSENENSNTPTDFSDQSLSQFFQTMYENHKQMVKEDRPIGYTTSVETYYIGQRNKFVSFIQTFEHYSGGAHGTYFNQYITVDVDKEKIITLDDLIRSENRKQLEEILWKKYQQSLIQDTGEVDEPFIDKADFFVPNNFYFSGTGIHFIYPLYSLAPYAKGEVELTVGYYEVSQWINQDYLPTEKDGANFKGDKL